MEPERVQALRDTKALYDDGVLDEAEYKAKKKELLALPQAKTATFADVAKKPDPRCGRVSDDGVMASEACPETCGTC